LQAELTVKFRQPFALSGVVSLLDMLRFYAEFFVEALQEVDEMLERWEPNDQIIPVPIGVGASLASLHAISVQHGLTATAQKCARIMDRCARPNPFEPITYREIVTCPVFCTK
jgi:hypothetical protein